MGYDYYTNPITFLIDTLFGLYILAITLRFLLQWARADFYNPISQFLVKATNPCLVPLRRLIPGWGGMDIAAIILIFTFTGIKLFVIYWIKGFTLTFPPILFLIAADVFELIISIFFFSILIQIIISWIAPQQYNPITAVLFYLTNPLLKPARQILPPISGFDFSPMLVLLFLQLSKMILIPPLLQLAT